jgi:predicted DNA-binding transcriptional regulator YafY
VRASRLVNVLLLLQTRGRLTAGELAAELEVSVRTIYRDVEALSEAGVPIYAERGPYGGIRLVDGYRTRLTGLTEDEAQGLFLSGLPGPAAELGLGTVVAAARLKMLAALPPELRTRASRIQERFHLDAPVWFKPAEEVPHLEALAAAVWDGRRVLVGYQRGDRDVERELDPLGLVLKAGIWYLVARAEEQVRTYRVSRVSAVAILDARVERPREFDLPAFWSEAIAAYERSLPTVDAEMRIPADRLWHLAEAVGDPSWRTAVHEPDPERAGWLRVRLRLESVPVASHELLRMGGGVEVLRPPELRDALLAQARAVLAAHATD